MKILLILSFLFSTAYGQKIALISKNFKSPIIYTDSVTVEQVSKYFPVEVTAFDSLRAGLVYLKSMLQDRQRAKMESFEFRAGLTSLITQRIPHAYGDHFEVDAKTTTGEITTVFHLTDQDSNNKTNSRRIGNFIEYLEQNKSLFTAATEIHPKFYNVIVVK